MPAILALALLACGGRTSPATQPAPASYDPSKNDAKALEIVEEMLGAAGGIEQWNAVKQIKWDMKIVVDGKIQALGSHAWDRWNARHRGELVSMKSYEESQAANDPDLIVKSVAMYRLFERNRGAGLWDGKPVSSEQKKEMIQVAYDRWKSDSFMLTMLFRTRDPGAYVALDGERDDEYCRNKCDVIKLSFAPEIGKDVYYLNVDRQTKLPVLIEIAQDGKSGRIAYSLSDWQEAGGLKFPGKLDNVGARNMANEEIWYFENVKIGSPDDDLYIPRVR